MPDPNFDPNLNPFPAPVGDLLSRSWETFLSRIRPILILSVIAGLVIGLYGIYMQRQLISNINQAFSSAGMDSGTLEEINRQIGAMGGVAGGTLQAEANKLTADQSAAFGMSFLRGTPKIIILSLGMAVLVLVLNYAFLVLAVGQSEDLTLIINRTMSLLFPLLGLSIWVGLRTFMWIPYIGFIIAIFLWPRFALAKVILVQEQKGVMESVRLSYLRTRGYWGKIVGNMLVCGTLLGIIGIVLMVPLSILGLFMPLATIFGWTILLAPLNAFSSIFLVHLAATIREHPFGMPPPPEAVDPLEDKLS